MLTNESLLLHMMKCLSNKSERISYRIALNTSYIYYKLNSLHYYFYIQNDNSQSKRFNQGIQNISLQRIFRFNCNQHCTLTLFIFCINKCQFGSITSTII